MIYTITFNPAIDFVVNVPKVTLGDLNRSTHEEYVIGGKGINMSVILNELHMPNIAVTFLGGFTGDYIQSELEKAGICTHVIEVDGVTRINVKLKSESETELNANGASVSSEKFIELVDYFETKLTPV